MAGRAVLRGWRDRLHSPVRAEAATVARAGAAAAVALLLLVPASPASAADEKAHEVTIGAYVNDIQDLDLRNHSFAGDLYVWLRWKDPGIDPAATLEIMNPYDLWELVRTPAYRMPQRLPDGSFYQVLRFQGRFSSKLSLEKYPFDKQTLTMVFEDDRYDADEVVFVPDVEPVAMREETELPGYEIGDPTLVISSDVYPTTFGDTSMSEPAPYSRVTISVPVARPSLTYVIKLLVPIFLVVLVAALVFLLHSSYVEARIAMGVTALLTLVALQFTTSAALPQAASPLMLDAIYVASYMFVVAVMAEAVATSWLSHRGDAARAVVLDRRMVVVSGIAYVLVVSAILAVYLLR